MRRIHLAALLAALFLCLQSATSSADPDKHNEHAEKAKDEKADKGEKGKPAKPNDNATDAGARKADTDEDEDEPKSADGGKVTGRRTPTQLAFRKTVWERNEKAVEAHAHKEGKHLSVEGRRAIEEHWLRVARLLRIRELAEADKNDAVVKRVDAQLDKEEKKIEAKLDKLQADGGAK